MSEMTVKVLLFASAREAADNQSSLTLTLKVTADTNVLRQELASRFPKLAPVVLDEESITLALNEEYVPSGEILPLKAGDIVALIPPISGG